MEPFIKLPESKEEKSDHWMSSRYTIQSKEEDGSLYLSNTYSGAFINVPPKHVTSVKNILKNGYDGELEGLPKILAHRGFIVKETTNELFRARMLHEIAGRKNDTLQLIFLVTEQCNFRCTYCYEKFEKGKMTKEVRESIKKYVRNKARFLKYLNIHWFGGEPLIAMDVIEELSLEFKKVCEEFDITYTASVTTNGYNLSPTNVKKLIEYNVSYFQVTVDGDHEHHDRTRHLAGGQSTFEKIWKNLLAMKETNEKFLCRIRVNFLKENLPDVPNFIDKIKENFSEDDRFAVNFFPVGQWGGPNDEELNVLTERDATKSALSLCDLAVDKGLNNVLDDILKPGGYVCYAAKPNSFVIGSDGMIYKCTVALYNEKNHIGTLQPDGTMDLDMDKFALWVMNDEGEDPGCQKCFFRPSCQGSACPLVRIETGEAPCPPEKKYIKQVVRVVGREKKRQLEKSKVKS
ncbi:radical SAM/SPASM domain-containing protein [Guptibacillus sedimenti]|uniref:radical SAM/SPASM domain-containing protein n=1 Tax=Guptibacillus sedimenti TaxID=3025680 RepID=UPI00235ED03E|nr:radical SAM protein [Pseudalkalibacillus sedimenti]